jgi:hypothetical protein
MTAPEKPVVTCANCSRQVVCVKMDDGTVYRPFEWTFPDPSMPLVGYCRDCYDALLAVASAQPTGGTVGRA